MSQPFAGEVTDTVKLMNSEYRAFFQNADHVCSKSFCCKICWAMFSTMGPVKGVWQSEYHHSGSFKRWECNLFATPFKGQPGRGFDQVKFLNLEQWTNVASCCIETFCKTWTFCLRWTAYGTVGSTGVFASSLAVEDGVPGFKFSFDFAGVSLNGLRRVGAHQKGENHGPWRWGSLEAMKHKLCVGKSQDISVLLFMTDRLIYCTNWVT